MTLQEAVDQFGYVSSDRPYIPASIGKDGKYIPAQGYELEVTVKFPPGYDVLGGPGDSVLWNGEIVTLIDSEFENQRMVKAVFLTNVTLLLT